MLALRGATVPLMRETLQCSPNKVCQHETPDDTAGHRSRRGYARCARLDQTRGRG